MYKLAINCCVFLFFVIHQVLNEQFGINSRSKRYLIFTPDTQYGAFATISIPLHPDTTVSVAWFFEVNYYIVDNSTYYQPLLGDIVTNSRSREERSTYEQKGLTRKYAYILIENMLEKHGFNGHACLLRAICENAASHFLHNGILGDILHLVLTPSTSMPEEDLEVSYYEAEFLGSEGLCEDYSVNCDTSPLHYISLYVEEL